MSELTPRQALLLFGLLARHGECKQAELMPAVTKADREVLVKAKLITASPRPIYLKLEDAGWGWASNHLSAQLPPGQGTLHNLLTRLADHIASSGETLADFIGEKPKKAAVEEPSKTEKIANETRSKKRGSKPGSSKPRDPTAIAVRKRIEKAYLNLTGGKKNESVKLARLRVELADLDRATIDAALSRILKGDKKASLMRHDDPRQIDKADEAAAFNPSGEPFHVLWIAS